MWVATKSGSHMGGPLKFFYWEDDPTRHLWPDAVGSEQALQDARSFAQAEQDKLNQR